MRSVVLKAWTATAALVAVLTGGLVTRADDALATKAVEVLKANCEKCHSGEKAKSGFRILDRVKWSEARYDGELPFFTEGDLGKSSIWQQVSEDAMPPKGPLSVDDKATLKEWLLAGAKFPGPEPTVDQTPIPSATDLASLAEAVKETKEELATKAFTILRTRCDECHGAVNQSFPGLEVLNPDKLLADRGKDRRGDDISRFAHPGKPDASMIIQVLKSNRMPPGPSGKKLPDGEKALLYKWILEGANFPGIDRNTRPVVSEEEILEEIANDLFSAQAAQRKFLRYVSFAHQGNNPKVTNEKMALYRAGFSKAINSLSRSSGLFLPRPVGRKDSNVRKAQVLYRIDFSEYGWDEIEHWQPILKAYPYGVDPAIHPNPKIGQFYKQIEALYGKASFDGVAYIRADWFTATATRPPLYHILSGTPKTQKELETKLGIDVISNFKLSKARRGGVQKSGVSQQNRLIEIHRTQQGIALVSYDFFTNAGRGNLARFPLGPNFQGNDFSQHAFQHDGGEIIYTLPNKLHGYMLVKATGERLDAGPVEIVYDQRQALGTPQIKNGVSCMLCHNKGTIPFKDTIRDAAAVLNAAARAKVEELYAETSEMDALLEDERDQYTNALKKVIEPFLLPNGPVEGRKSFEDFDEPVGVTTVDFTTDISRDQAAYELGIDPDAFKGALANSKKLNELGLRPLVSGERLKRSLLESDGSTLSVFQEVASELGLGTPVRN